MDHVTDKSKGEWKLHFLELKTRSYILNLVPRMLKIAFYWALIEISKFSGEARPLEKGD